MKNLLLFCLCLLFGSLSFDVEGGCLEADSLELVRIYDDCGGAGWDYIWDLNAPVSTWYGVTLTEDGCGVYRLILRDMNLTGAFPNIKLSNSISLYLENNKLTVIPDFSNLNNMTYLVLSNNQLTTIPDFSNLNSMTYLCLSGNQLTTIPDLSNLNSMTSLNLSDNQLTTIPDLSNLYNLTELGLSNNQLTTIPDFSNLNNLTGLSLYNNQLTTIPDLSNLNSLIGLDLRNNQLTTIPDFSILNSLTDLDLSYNQLTTIPDFPDLNSLTHLNLSNNQLTSIPDFSNLNSMTCLDLFNNKLTIIPDFSNLNSMTYLDLRNNQLTVIPDFPNLNNLTYLDLRNNKLTTIPDFSNLSNLTVLNLNSNQLTTIPDFSNLNNLTTLYLYNNQLTTVPDFSNLSNLTALFLSGNPLTTVPDFSNLSNLTTLGLSSNQLTTVPDFSNLSNLTTLSLNSNQLTTIPDFSNLNSLTYLALSNNQLNYTPLVLHNGIETFTYSPQDSISLITENSQTLRFLVGGNPTDNTFTWYKNNIQIATIPADSTLTITTSGTYRCEATNNQLPDLTLYSKALTINPQTNCIAQDSLQLLKIYTACNGPTWNSPWNLNQAITTWQGITLTSDGCHVESIDFGFFGNGLTGTFPSLNLEKLKTLTLIRNELDGIESLDGMPSLEFLELSNTGLTEIPALDNLVNLEHLHLANNELSNIPDYSYLTKLKTLSLFNNQLEQVPDYSMLTQLEKLHIYSNRLNSIPAYDGLANLAFLSIENNLLDFSDISPQAGDFSYVPQDSIALSALQGDLVFDAGGDLANNSYTWYKDDLLQSTIVGDNRYTPTGAGTYRCEATSSLLAALTLFSKEMNVCANGLVNSSYIFVSQGNAPYCLGDEIGFQCYGNADLYSFFVNGNLVQESTNALFTSSTLKDGDVVSLIVKTADGCQYIPFSPQSSTGAISVEFQEEIDLLICQTDATSFNIKLRQGSPPWSFNLTEYNSGLEVATIPKFVNTSSLNLPQNPNSYYKITNLQDANCNTEKTYTSPHIKGCAAVCVGYSQPQSEYFTAKFGKRVAPGSLTWTIAPADAITNGDLEIVGETDDFVLQVNFLTATPNYEEITLSVSAPTDCGTETLQHRILLDQNCIWPGDINDDGQVKTNSPGIPWIDDAIALSRAITVQEAIKNSQNNEVLLNHHRPPSCLAEKPYDWVPQSSKNWAVDSAGVIRPLPYQLFDDVGNVTVNLNLKYSDADGNSTLEDENHYNAFQDDFDTLSVYSDIDVVAYQEQLGNTHVGNAPAAYKMETILPEMLHISVSDSTIANGDEVVFLVALGAVDNTIENVVQVAFRADGAFGSYERPAIDLSQSHLSISHSDLADYPYLRANWQGIQEDSLEWLVSLESKNQQPKTFVGETICNSVCHATVAAFAGNNPQNKNFNNPLGIPRTFKITAGIQLADGRTLYAQSNEVTIYIKPDPLLAAKVFLEGAYDASTGLMRDNLREAGLIPNSEPFSTLAGYHFPKKEVKGMQIFNPTAVLATTGPEAIVDWVLVEIWQGSTHLSSRPALLTRSGNVVDMDGKSAVPMTRVPYGAYDIVLRHRNHLPVKTLSPISLGESLAVLDFSAGGATLQRELSAGRFGLFAGDASCILHGCLGGYSIDAEDKSYWYTKNGLYRIYNNADFDMNTDVNGMDRVLFEGNNGTSVSMPR